MITKKASIKGVNMGSSNFKRDIPLYVDLYLQGRINLDDLLSQTIGIDEINEGYESFAKGGIARTVITTFQKHVGTGPSTHKVHRRWTGSQCHIQWSRRQRTSCHGGGSAVGYRPKEKLNPKASTPLVTDRYVSKGKRFC